MSENTDRRVGNEGDASNKIKSASRYDSTSESEQIFSQAVTCDGNTWYPSVAEHVTKVEEKYYSAIYTKYYEEIAFFDHGNARMTYKRRDSTIPLISELVTKSKKINEKPIYECPYYKMPTTSVNSNAIKHHCNECTNNGATYDPSCHARRAAEPAVDGVWPEAKLKPIRVKFQRKK